MPYLLSKIGFWLVMPSNLVGFSALLGLALFIFKLRRGAIACITLSAMLMGIFGYSPVSNAMLVALEERFPQHFTLDKAPDGIIILGGSFDTVRSWKRGKVELGDSTERLIEGLRLHRQYPQAKLIFSSGSTFDNAIMPGEALLFKRMLDEIGQPSNHIIFEPDSMTTYENALFSAKLLNPKPDQKWLLVTSAFHMPRAIAFFRQAGFHVIAAPVDYRTNSARAAFRPNSDAKTGFDKADTAAKEWIGMFAYWVTGKTQEFSPTP